VISKEKAAPTSAPEIRNAPALVLPGLTGSVVKATGYPDGAAGAAVSVRMQRNLLVFVLVDASASPEVMPICITWVLFNSEDDH